MLIWVIGGWGIFSEITLQWMSLDFTDGKLVNICSGNSQVPPGNKPLPEAMATQIYVAIWCHSGHNQFKSISLVCNGLAQHIL